MSEDGKDFEVTDKRKLNKEEAGPSAEAAAPKAATPEAAEAKADETPKTDAGNTGGEPDMGKRTGDLPPIDFMSFIGSLGATVLMHFGEQLAPGQPASEVSLPAARQMIDLLDLLKQKTEGNLDEEEDHALKNLLYNLKMRYAHEIAGKASGR